MQNEIRGDQLMPLARTKDILVQKAGRDMLVYDVETNEAHSLNQTVGLIWRSCDGKTRINEVTSLLGKELKKQIEVDFVILALAELKDANLLKTTGEQEYLAVSRREVLFKYALPTISLPVVLTLVAPSSVQAQSCGMLQDPCSGGGAGSCCPGIDACQSSLCCNGVGSPCSVQGDCCGFFSCDGSQCL